MKRIFKYIALVVLTLALVVSACACGSASVTKPQPSDGAQTCEIKGSVAIEKLNDTTIRVNCEANLETGTVLAISIDSYNGEELSKQVFSKGEGDKFYADFTIDSKWQKQKPIYGSLTISPNEEGDQPDAVKDVYGSRFENVTGDNVLFNANGNFVCIMSEEFSDF